jgi:hypothetical protein
MSLELGFGDFWFSGFGAAPDYRLVIVTWVDRSSVTSCFPRRASRWRGQRGFAGVRDFHFNKPEKQENSFMMFLKK